MLRLDSFLSCEYPIHTAEGEVVLITVSDFYPEPRPPVERNDVDLFDLHRNQWPLTPGEHFV